MGTEYYLVKPERKEIFYLGKHIMCPEGIVNKRYKKNAEWFNYDCFDDFFWDFLRENYEEFLTTELNLEQLRNIIFSIYDWCKTGKIYFDNDCNDNAEWLNWKETGSLSNLIGKEHIIQSINYMKEQKMDVTEEELAKYIFDGDLKKSKILLELIHKGQIDEIKTILPLEMNIPDE